MFKGEGVERSLRELRFQDNDRVPIAGGFICKATFLEKVAGLGPFWSNPRAIAIEVYRRLRVDLVIQLVLPKRPEECTSWSGPTNFSKKEPCERFTVSDVVDYVEQLPSPSEVRKGFDSKAVYQDFLEMMIKGQREMRGMLWMPFFARACRFMWYSKFGFRPYLLALMRYPDEMRHLFALSAEEEMMRNKAIARAIADNDLPRFLYFGEDICYNKGPMVPVRLLREIYFPYLERSIQPLKEHGVRIIWHSDGNIMPILKDLLDCGIDGLQGFQSEADERLSLIHI